MFIKSVRAAIPTSLWMTVFLAVGLVGCAPITSTASAGEVNTSEFCQGIDVASPHLILKFDQNGNAKPVHAGKPVNFPPKDGNGTPLLIKEFAAIPVTVFEGSTWFCYKIAGVRKCIEY